MFRMVIVPAVMAGLKGTETLMAVCVRVYSISVYVHRQKEVRNCGLLL